MGNSRPRKGETRGQWQCIQVCIVANMYVVYVWERNRCGVQVYEKHDRGEVEFYSPNLSKTYSWENAIKTAIRENNKRINSAKKYLNENDYCDNSNP